jgi:hypothetical protein
MRAMSSADSKLSSTARSRRRPGLGSFEFAAKDIYDSVRRICDDAVPALHGNGAIDRGPTRPGGREVSPSVPARLLIVRPFMDGEPKTKVRSSVVPDVFGIRLLNGKLECEFQQSLKPDEGSDPPL